MAERRPDDRFVGRIAGVGTASGTRIVIGMWEDSPLGRFADVMLEDRAGHRLLLAPSAQVADYVSATYSFDEVQVVPVAWRRVDGGLRVTAGDLDVRLTIGGISRARHAAAARARGASRPVPRGCGSSTRSRACSSGAPAPRGPPGEAAASSTASRPPGTSRR